MARNAYIICPLCKAEIQVRSGFASNTWYAHVNQHDGGVRKIYPGKYEK